MRQLYAQTSMRLVTQNVRGLTPEKLEMIIHTMKDRGINTLSALPKHEKIIDKHNIEGTSLSFIALHHKTHAHALVFEERRRLSALVPTAIKRIIRLD